MKASPLRQAGFAHMELIGIALVIAVISFIGGTVYMTNKRNNAQKANDTTTVEDKSADKIETTEADKDELAEETVNEEEKEAVTPPPPPPTKTITETEKKTDTYVEKTKFTIASINASVGDSSVVFTAGLGNEYAGTCEVTAKSPNYAEDGIYKTFKNDVNGSDTCAVTATLDKFPVAGQWKFTMIYYNDSYTVKGSYPEYKYFTI